MNQDIKKRIESIGNNESTRLFFELLNYLIENLKLGPDNEKLAINVRNDYRKRISVNLNSRLVLYLKDGDEFGFMVNDTDIDSIESNLKINLKENFKGEGIQTSLISVSLNAVKTNINLIKEFWIKSCADYEPMQSKSQYRTHHISELYNLAVDPNLLEQYLQKGMDYKNSFPNIVNDLRDYLKGENNKLSSFVVQDIVGKSKWVWVWDDKRIIGDILAHYEILFKYDNLYVNIHFEGEKVQQDIFSNRIGELPVKLNWIKWQGSKSIEYADSFALNDTDLLRKLSDCILYMDDVIGNQVRDIKSEIDIEIKVKMQLNPLNQILFGPPGTGKTYNTINKAVSLANKEFDLNQSRDIVKKEYDRLVNEGQIVFTTFHQSMSYEDFIEGIKPSSTDKMVRYDVKDGIFKSIGKVSSSKKKITIKVDDEVLVLTKELLELFYNALAGVLPKHEETHSEYKLNTVENYQFEMYRNTAGSIVVKAGQKRTDMVISLNELSLVIFEDKKPTYKSYEFPIIEKIFEGMEYSPSKVDNSSKNYVIIIDEINRGNVSQIFGELITLIEDDKRLGQAESLEVILPYSKEKFGVPPNLYIIGTMNTADRSVEALDAALRRRFSFTEMPPQTNLLNPYNRLGKAWGDFWIELDNAEYWKKWHKVERGILELAGLKKDDKAYTQLSANWKDRQLTEWRQIADYERIFTDSVKDSNNGIRLDRLLNTINLRIEKLLDKDHQIGHSYFLSVYSIEDLKAAFQNKIIPLLQEYFFGDYGKIGLVLGRGFVEKKENETIFADFDKELASELSEGPTYTLKNVLNMAEDEFRSAITLLMGTK